MTGFDPTSCTNTVWFSYTMRCCTCLLMTSAPEFASFKMTSFCVYFQSAILPQIKIKNIHLFSIERIQTHNLSILSFLLDRGLPPLVLTIFLNGPNPAYFCLFWFFLNDKCSTNTINDKSIEGVLGTRTWGGRMVGADECTELWRHPLRLNYLKLFFLYIFGHSRHLFRYFMTRFERESSSVAS